MLLRKTMILDRVFHDACTSPLDLTPWSRVTKNLVTAQLTRARQAAPPRHLQHTPTPSSPQAENRAEMCSKPLPHFEESSVGAEILREGVGCGTVPVFLAVAGYGDRTVRIRPEYGAVR